MINFVNIYMFFDSSHQENVCFCQILSKWQVKIMSPEIYTKAHESPVLNSCVCQHFVANYKAPILIWFVGTTTGWTRADDYCSDIPVNLGKTIYFDKPWCNQLVYCTFQQLRRIKTLFSDKKELLRFFQFEQSYCKKQRCICIHYVISVCLYLLIPVDFLAFNYYITQQFP